MKSRVADTGYFFAEKLRGRASSKKEPIRAKLAQIQKFRKEEQDCYRILCDSFHSLYEWKENYAPEPEDTLTPGREEATSQTSKPVKLAGSVDVVNNDVK